MGLVEKAIKPEKEQENVKRCVCACVLYKCDITLDLLGVPSGTT